MYALIQASEQPWEGKNKTKTMASPGPINRSWLSRPWIPHLMTSGLVDFLLSYYSNKNGFELLNPKSAVRYLTSYWFKSYI